VQQAISEYKVMIDNLWLRSSCLQPHLSLAGAVRHKTRKNREWVLQEKIRVSYICQEFLKSISLHSLAHLVTVNNNLQENE